MNFKRHNLILLFAMLLAFAGGIGSASAQEAVDNGQASLSSSKFPWYDADNDSLQPMETAPSQKALTEDRNTLPMGTKTATGGGRGGGRVDLAGLSYLTWALIAIFILGVVGALLWAFLKMENKQTTRDEGFASGKSLEERIKELPFDLDKSAGDLQTLAREAYQSGDYKTAITLLFSHVLLQLDKASLIRLRKGKTNRQYLGELRSHHELKHYYEHVMVPFEDTFFGDHDLKRERFEDCWNKLEQFENNVNQAVQVAV